MTNQRPGTRYHSPEANASNPGSSFPYTTHPLGNIQEFPYSHNSEGNLMTSLIEPEPEFVARASISPVAYQAARADIPLPTVESQASVEVEPQRQPKKIQNRAPFGRWQTKVMPGFPGPDMPLPPELSAHDICRYFPNHVDDHVICSLMRLGLGAKAIDALMPAPQGRIKAGQSHSKIQLRIRTIREHFANEHFPIPSTRRIRQRDPTAEVDQVFSSNDRVFANHQYVSIDNQQVFQNDGQFISNNESPNFHNANTIFAQTAIESPSPNRAMSFHQPIPQQLVTNSALYPQVPARASPNRHNQSSNTHIPRPPKLPSNIRTQSGHTQVSDQAIRSSVDPFELSTVPLHRPMSSIRDEILAEYEKHQKLVFEAFYYSPQVFKPAELLKTVRKHCHDRYGAESQKLQTILKRRIDKLTYLNGDTEHALIYLERCSLECYKEIPQYWSRVGLVDSLDQVPDQIEAHNEKRVLELLQSLTEEVMKTIEVNELIKTHASLQRIVNRTPIITPTRQSNTTPSHLHPVTPRPGSASMSHIKSWDEQEALALQAEQEQHGKYPAQRKRSAFFSQASSSSSIDPRLQQVPSQPRFALIGDDELHVAKRVKTESGEYEHPHDTLMRSAAATDFHYDNRDRKTSLAHQQGIFNGSNLLDYPKSPANLLGPSNLSVQPYSYRQNTPNMPPSQQTITTPMPFLQTPALTPNSQTSQPPVATQPTAVTEIPNSRSFLPTSDDMFLLRTCREASEKHFGIQTDAHVNVERIALRGKACQERKETVSFGNEGFDIKGMWTWKDLLVLEQVWKTQEKQRREADAAADAAAVDAAIEASVGTDVGAIANPQIDTDAGAGVDDGHGEGDGLGDSAPAIDVTALDLWVEPGTDA